MTANEARNETKYRVVVKDIMNKLATEIEKSIDKGKFSTSCSINLDTPSPVRKMLRAKLEKLGYKVCITDYMTTERNAPVDQMSYYDVITISWAEK
jgi:hypothetical protein